MAWFLAIIIGFALQVVGYLLAPKPKKDKPREAQDLEAPSVESGREMPVIFGTVNVIVGLQVLWYGDKSQEDREISV